MQTFLCARKYFACQCCWCMHTLISWNHSLLKKKKEGLQLINLELPYKDTVRMILKLISSWLSVFQIWPFSMSNLYDLWPAISILALPNISSARISENSTCVYAAETFWLALHCFIENVMQICVRGYYLIADLHRFYVCM